MYYTYIFMVFARTHSCSLSCNICVSISMDMFEFMKLMDGLYFLKGSEQRRKVMCVELVGNRFLRKV